MWLMTDSKDELPPLLVSDLPSEFHGNEPLLPINLYPRFTKHIGNKRASVRRLRALDFGSPAPKSTSPPAAARLRTFRCVLHATARHQVIRNKTIQSSGLDPTSLIPPKPVTVLEIRRCGGLKAPDRSLRHQHL
jgi:hypothetical protein